MAAVLTALLTSTAVSAQERERPLLVILSETGEEQEGLPVYTVHPRADSIAEILSRGFSGLFLRVYRMEQQYLRTKEGVEAEPAYVLMSNHQGGYAREGFMLEGEAKPDAGYVDVYREWPLFGRFGAVDQIMPHELAHVICRQLVGKLRDGGTNQVHAVGLRTDRIVAFNEGFAEHLQAVAFDRSPDVPEMSELAADSARLELVQRNQAAYREELSARFAPAARMRLGFLAWYPNAEDILRYHGIRNNLFAREPAIPHDLIRNGPYRAYLLEAILTGAPDGPTKSLGRMASSEGVVSAFYYQWAMDEHVGRRRDDPQFYSPFGVGPSDVTDLENTYLKMIDAIYEHKPQTVFEMVQGYTTSFPEEKDRVDAIARRVFHGPLDSPPVEIWMANRDFETGTTLFDQYRGLRRTHTFDLNAASIVDLVTVTDVSPDLARRILAGAPYEEVDDLRHVDGISDELADRFAGMQQEMDVLREELATATDEALSVTAILRPAIVRAVAVVLLAAALGLVGYLTVRRRAGLPSLRWFRLASYGLLIGLLGCAGGWLLGTHGLGAVGAVVVLCGVPSAGWHLYRGRRRVAWINAVAWTVAAVPAAVLTGAWF